LLRSLGGEDLPSFLKGIAGNDFEMAAAASRQDLWLENVGPNDGATDSSSLLEFPYATIVKTSIH
jgi:hypothetical protein